MSDRPAPGDEALEVAGVAPAGVDRILLTDLGRSRPHRAAPARPPCAAAFDAERFPAALVVAQPGGLGRNLAPVANRQAEIGLAGARVAYIEHEARFLGDRRHCLSLCLKVE